MTREQKPSAEPILDKQNNERYFFRKRTKETIINTQKLFNSYANDDINNFWPAAIVNKPENVNKMEKHCYSLKFLTSVQ